MSVVNLTKAQTRILRLAYQYTNNMRYGSDGVWAAGSAIRSITKLESLGFVKCVGYGPDTNGDSDVEKAIYAITKSGVRYLSDIGLDSFPI